MQLLCLLRLARLKTGLSLVHFRRAARHGALVAVCQSVLSFQKIPDFLLELDLQSSC